jgi:hypothetical protein
MPDSTKPLYVWYAGCRGCGKLGFQHFRTCVVAAFVIRLAVLCGRCKTYNAPHVDRCPCSSAFSAT